MAKSSTAVCTSAPPSTGLLPPALPGAPADWHIVVTSPLRLTNQLPVTGTLLVWEQQGGSKDLVGRQTVQVASGATVPIHTGEHEEVPVHARCGGLHSRKGASVIVSLTGVHWWILWPCCADPLVHLSRCLPTLTRGAPAAADMRKVVSFSFYPEGYEWTEPTPTILSEGHSGTHPALLQQSREGRYRSRSKRMACCIGRHAICCVPMAPCPRLPSLQHATAAGSSCPTASV